MEKTSEIQELIDAALNASNKNARIDAVSQLSDQETLKQVALHDENQDVRKAAVVNLEDQETLIQAALHDDAPFVRKAAVKKIDDGKVLEQVALYDRDKYVREAAANQIYDAGGRFIGGFMRYVIDYMRSYNFTLYDIVSLSRLPKGLVIDYLCGKKPNLADFARIAEALGIDFSQFTKDYGVI